MTKFTFILLSLFLAIANVYAKAKVTPLPADLRNTYIITFHDKQIAEKKTREIEASNKRKVRHKFQAAINAISIDLSQEEFDKLKKDTDVKSIEKVTVVELHSQSIPTGVRRINTELSPVANIDGVDQRVDADVAVIDTGVDLDHPDLNVFKYVYCYQVNPVSGNCNENDNQADDASGHGTHVAGIIGALDNNIGVVGVAPGARLWAIDVTRSDGVITSIELLAALNYVYLNAADIEVVNMSLGFVGSSPSVDSAISAIVAAGVTFVASAGNDAIDVAGVSPAGHPDIITVSAFTDFDGLPGSLGNLSFNYSICTESIDDSLACFSNYGSGVDISAPGVKINSTYLNGGYAEMHGTSMASPHVAGAAALYIASTPGTTPASVKAYLLANGDNNPCSVNGTVCADDPDPYNEPLVLTAPHMDTDLDTIVDFFDNCLSVANPDQLDTDGDSLGNACDEDDDGDLIPDSWELDNNLDPLDAADALLDNDNDQLTNLQEYNNSTNPNNADTDDDGFNDGLEISMGTNPLDKLSYPEYDEDIPFLPPWAMIGLLVLLAQVGARRS